MVMDLTWVKDYGALTAASVAAVVTIVNSFFQARRDRNYRTSVWFRELRTARYISFLRAANDYRTAIFWRYANPDPEITGPPPKDAPDYDTVVNEFGHQLAEVTMVGPARIAAAAKIVQYACWKYVGQLESRPWDYDQSLTSKVLNDFIAEAQVALGIEISVSAELAYRDWLKSLPADDD
jgi:hypothetical protein